MNIANNYAEHFYSGLGHDLHTLEENVKNYPASSIARFLLLYHQKKSNDPAFEITAKKTGIYLNNPFWIQFQLVQSNSETTGPQNDETIESSPTEENKNEGDYSIITTETNDIVVTSGEVSHTSNDSGVIKNRVENSNGEETVPPDIIENTTSITPSEILPSSGTSASPMVSETEQKHEDINITGIPIEGGEGNIPETIAGTSSLQSEPVSSTEFPQDSSSNSENPPTNKPSEEENTLAFEPLHTVDYFASQGIKISEEVLENDRLGKQVKSFTAWLKSMKKLHPGELPEQNEVIEKIIQSSAEASNNEANILTEAMAEVLIKQDKKGKAIEMYQKLSLINPSKSAYFASKIESLKTN
ncbi:MAG: hypothetical protein ABI237_16575 [Ginsengibacter sp.]